MRILQILGIIVVSVMMLATPSLADHHKKGGPKPRQKQNLLRLDPQVFAQ